MTRVLSVHAAYGCRERGACCTAGWPIPIEGHALDQAERALADGRLAAAAPAVFYRPTHAPPETPALIGIVDGACAFHRSSGVARCALHHALGHAALPLACRQFPRVSVVDPRGVSITLSHYCPTAAELLDAPAQLTIVERASAVPEKAEDVGLDVRDGFPPPIRPDMLSDWNAWWRWEERAVALLAATDEPAAALERLSVAVEQVRTWTPGAGPLAARIDGAFDAARRHRPPPRQPRNLPEVTSEILAAIPGEFRAEALAALAHAGSKTTPRAHRVFLAAHAFASWTAHLGGGLRTWLRSIDTAHCLLDEGVGVRQADLLLRHLADPHALARQWSRAESE